MFNRHYTGNRHCSTGTMERPSRYPYRITRLTQEDRSPNRERPAGGSEKPDWWGHRRLLILAAAAVAAVSDAVAVETTRRAIRSHVRPPCCSGEDLLVFGGVSLSSVFFVLGSANKKNVLGSVFEARKNKNIRSEIPRFFFISESAIHSWTQTVAGRATAFFFLHVSSGTQDTLG